MDEEEKEEAPPVHLNLDDPDVVDHQFAFLQEGEDCDFWDDFNITKMLGNIDIKAHRINQL